MDEILGLNEKKHCENEEEHDGHYYKGEVTINCSGKTECGAWAHLPHQKVEQRDIWCSGICNCKLRNYKHGPGSHK